MLQFLLSQLDYLSFLGGLSFLILTSICFSFEKKYRLDFSWRWFGIFALIQGFKFWLDLAALGIHDHVLFQNIRFEILTLSYLVLFEFARRLCNQKKYVQVCPWVLPVIAGISLVGIFLRLNILIMASPYVIGVVACGFACFAIFRILNENVTERKWLGPVVIALGGWAVGCGVMIMGLVLNPGINLFNEFLLMPWALGVEVTQIVFGFIAAIGIWKLSEGKSAKATEGEVGFDSRNLVLILGLLLVLIIVVSWNIAQQAGESEAKIRKAWLLSIAQHKALKINSELIKKIEGSSNDLTNWVYQKEKTILQDLKSVVPHVRFIYLLRKVQDKVVFLVDSEPVGSPDESPPGQVYSEATPGLIEIFDTGKPFVEGPFADRWGSWVSAFAPILDNRTGELIAVLGVDQGVKEYHLAVAEIRMKVIGLFSLLAIALILAFHFRHQFLISRNTTGEVLINDKFVQRGTFVGVVMVGLVITLLAFLIEYRASKNSFQTVFRQRAASRAIGVSHAITDQLRQLENLRQFFSANSSITREQFGQIVQPMLQGVPLKEMYWAPKVLTDHRKDFEKENQSGMTGAYEISELDSLGHKVAARQRTYYFPIQWVEPRQGKEKASGNDLAFDVQLSQYLEKTIKDGRLVVSQPISLEGGAGDLKGFAVFMPVFEKELGRNVESGTWETLKGVMVAIFESGKFLKGAYSSFPAEGLACLIEDRKTEIGQKVLYRHKLRLGEVDWDHPVEKYRTILDVGDREWQMTVVPGTAFIEANWDQGYKAFLAGGVLITILLALFINMLMIRRHEAEKMIRSLIISKEKVEETNRLKSEFIFNISHEMRTPLNGIIGFAELVQVSKELGQAHSMSRLIIEESDVLLALVNEVLDQAKLEAGKINLDPTPVDLQEIIKYVSRKAEMQASKKGLLILVKIEPGVPRFIVADRLRLCQVLINLLTNAVKFTFKGTVSLSVSYMGNDQSGLQLRFSVTDTGIGIPKEKQHLIFQHFTQVDGTLTRHFGGAGLGLSIAKGLVELMGGKIGFESQVSEGTTFWFTLPIKVAADSKVPSGVSVQEAQNLGVMSDAAILVVEDYSPNQDIVRVHLEDAGYKVKVAANGAVALEICSREEVHLILMDIQMPVMDGYETTKQLRLMEGWRKKVPILGFTANADNKTLHECLAIGMNGIIVKPIRRASFLSEVAMWIKPPESSSFDEESEESLTVVAEPTGKLVVFDHATAVEEFGGNTGLLDIMVKSFLLQVRQQVVVLEDAVNQNDAITIGKEAHKIRGAAANLTATRLAQKAKELELKGKATDFVGLDALLKEFKAEVEAFEDYVIKGYRNV